MDMEKIDAISGPEDGKRVLMECGNWDRAGKLLWETVRELRQMDKERAILWRALEEREAKGGGKNG